MTIEEAWMFWMKTNRSTTEPPTVTDFDVIKKSSHWAAFEAGWHAANSNNEVWNQAYGMGLAAGKREWVGLTNEEIVGFIAFDGASLADFIRYIEAKLKEKNT